MCNLCANLQAKVHTLEEQVITLESRLKDITGDLLRPIPGASLSTSELKLVNFLYNYPGYADTEQLLIATRDNPYADDSPSDSVVKIFIMKARRKLAPLGITIENRWNGGYCMPQESKAILSRLLTCNSQETLGF